MMFPPEQHKVVCNQCLYIKCGRPTTISSEVADWFHWKSHFQVSFHHRDTQTAAKIENNVETTKHFGKKFFTALCITRCHITRHHSVPGTLWHFINLISIFVIRMKFSIFIIIRMLFYVLFNSLFAHLCSLLSFFWTIGISNSTILYHHLH